VEFRRHLLVDGIHLSSCFDPVSEVQLRVATVPKSENVIWVYGLASGDFQRGLLCRDTLQQLEVVILSSSLLMVGLRFFEHEDWLSDSRAKLHLANLKTELRTPFCVVSACLKLIEPVVAQLRDLIVFEFDTSYINAKVLNHKQFQRQTQNNAVLLKQDYYVQELFGSRRHGCCT